MFEDIVFENMYVTNVHFWRETVTLSISLLRKHQYL